ncbi:MAG: S-layer homology domain-containing protein, partial [Psychrobacillus psychrotolerans]|uniref:S-layer homology domain-containing protein n=1 Tax=Psychrobacillus psychrotolerans TaxID=126156 RepID=UPI003BAF0757
VLSVSAVTGEWFNGKEFLVEQPTKKEYERVTNSALPVRQNGMTKEEAKKAAEKLLQVKSDKVKLSIQSVEEVKNSYGQEVISIQYMYNYANGGSGSSLEFDKKTGELLQYHNVQNSMMIELNGTKEEVAPISKEEAIAQAVKYLKELVPSYLHEYAMPLEDSYVDDARGNYYLNFPRIVNGVMVSGDQISVSIYKDGSLENLSVSRPQIEEWPTLDKVISLKEVENTLSKALSLKMSYMKGNHKKENSHYDLIYSPLFNETAFNVLDANSGKWINQYNIEVTPEVSHATAAEELNYLIKAKVLTVNDPKTFNGDAAVSKGEAIKIMMNSLTYIYETNIRESESMKQSFTNINSKHASYQAVERAVEAGILKTDQKTFDVNNPVTKEELAVWYIRALGLEQAAIQKNIFKNEFTDGKKVTEANIGYVILANSLGLVKAEKNHFNPKKEITYADLAVSSIRLAHEISNKGRDFRYSY